MFSVAFIEYFNAEQITISVVSFGSPMCFFLLHSIVVSLVLLRTTFQMFCMTAHELIKNNLTSLSLFEKILYPNDWYYVPQILFNQSLANIGCDLWCLNQSNRCYRETFLMLLCAEHFSLRFHSAQHNQFH